MSHWLSMYRDFTQMIDLAANPSRGAYRDVSGCEDIPKGPTPAECGRSAPCSIECLVAWYIESKGLSFIVEWGWAQNLHR